MELLGKWKLASMLSVGNKGFCRMTAEEIAEAEETPKNIEHKRMIAAEFILSDSSLDVYYTPKKGEEELGREKGWMLTERGLLIEHFPAKIENGVLYLDYMKNGVEYSPTWIDEDGCLALSGGLMKLRKA